MIIRVASVGNSDKINRHRWGIETMFREHKCTLRAESIHAQSMEGVMQELDAMLLHLTMAATLEIAAVAEMIDHADLAFWRKNHSVNRSTMQAIIASMLLADGSNDANKRGASAATRSTELSVVVWVGSIQEIPVNCAVLRAMPLEIGGDVPPTVDLT